MGNHIIIVFIALLQLVCCGSLTVGSTELAFKCLMLCPTFTRVIELSNDKVQGAGSGAETQEQGDFPLLNLLGFVDEHCGG